MNTKRCISCMLLWMMLYCHPLYSQTIRSISDGIWSDASIWSTGVIPSTTTETQLIIDHVVNLPSPMSISVYQLVVNNKLTIDGGATLNITADALTAVPDLQIYGILEIPDGAILNGTSSKNTTFESGSLYIHRQGPLGFIPLASWNRNSTFQVSGFTSSGYINIAHSDSWKQTFGNVVYDCPAQSVFVVDLNGYLRNVAGDLIVRNTNSRVLRLSTTQNPTINVGGNFLVEGPSEVWFSTNSTNCIVNVSGNYSYKSTSTGPSYLTTRGIMQLVIVGDLQIDSPGPIRMASSSTDSIGTRQATIRLHGNLIFPRGTLIAPPSGSGRGRIVFEGSGRQSATISPTTLQGNMEYTVEGASTLDLGLSVLSADVGSLTVKGRLSVGSTDAGGAIQLTNQGNIRIPGVRTYAGGSTIEYNGTAPQRMALGHPESPDVNLVCSNPTLVTMDKDISIGNFDLLAGTFETNGFNLTIHGDALFDTDVSINEVTLAGDRAQQVSGNGISINNMTITKAANAIVSLESGVSIAKLLTINSPNTSIHTNGHLTLLSTGDDATGTASVGPLPPGALIEGNVTVQRFMAGEGRIYRYISSPIANATVGSLMDDFPITGSFANPTSDGSVVSTSPSLFEYDESVGGLVEGWKPYPVVGTAEVNGLQIGKGYAAFIRNGSTPTILDFTGSLNQGDITFPLAYTGNGAPGNGWNLVGNPYACAIDWDPVGVNGWSKQSVSNVISIRDNGAGGIYHYWDGDVNYDDLPNGHIASGQSFWVRATADNASLTIREGVKVVSGAAFYRANSDISSLRVRIAHDGQIDQAYFKLRSGADDGLDDWDAVKLPNDNLNIAFIAQDGNQLAIDAREHILCKDEKLGLFISGTPGEYTIIIDAKNLLANFRYRIVDHFNNEVSILKPGDSLRYLVTEAKGSQAHERFSIQLEQYTQSFSVDIQAFCSGDTIMVKIKNTVPSINYALCSQDHLQLSKSFKGTGNDEVIKYVPEKGDRTTLELHVSSACDTTIMNINLPGDELSEIDVQGQVVGFNERALLKAFSTNSEMNYSWFDSRTSKDTLGNKKEFLTPCLKSSRLYFVCGTTPKGCGSERVPVSVQVVPRVSSLEFATEPDGNMIHLLAGHLDDRLPHGSGELKPDTLAHQIFGVYLEGCTDTGSRTISNNGNRGSRYHLYPNPASDAIFISPSSDIQDVLLYDLSGKCFGGYHCEVLDFDSHGKVNISDLPASTYVVKIISGSVVEFHRFIKVSE